MQTKFGDKLVNFAKSHNAYAKKSDGTVIMCIYFAFTLNVYLIPADILEKFPFLWQFCKFIASFVPLIERLILQQAPENIIFYFSYMTIFFIIFSFIYIYKAFFYIFGADDPFETAKRNAKDSPIYATLGWISLIIFFGFNAYDIYSGSFLDGKVSSRRGTSELTFIKDILQGGKFSSVIISTFISGLTWISFNFLFSIIRLNFCTKLNIKRLKLKLFLLFCVFIGFIWVLKYYMVI